MEEERLDISTKIKINNNTRNRTGSTILTFDVENADMFTDSRLEERLAIDSLPA